MNLKQIPISSFQPSTEAYFFVPLVTLCLILYFLYYHIIRTIYRNQGTNVDSKYNVLILSYAIVGVFIVLRTISLIADNPHIRINYDMCLPLIKLYLSLSSLFNFVIHLFVAFRSQINSQTRRKYKIYFNVGILLIFITDLLLCIYIVTPLPALTYANYQDVLCIPKIIDISIYVWYAVSDFIIVTILAIEKIF